jgi:hypothetical protein
MWRYGFERLRLSAGLPWENKHGCGTGDPNRTTKLPPLWSNNKATNSTGRESAEPLDSPHLQ